MDSSSNVLYETGGRIRLGIKITKISYFQLRKSGKVPQVKLKHNYAATRVNSNFCSNQSKKGNRNKVTPDYFRSLTLAILRKIIHPVKDLKVLM